MNYDEFAFFNNQLAGMLRSGIPIEGALKQLSSGMRRGRLRKESEALEDDLQAGVPLDQAIAKRDLPIVYISMLKAGAKGENLPAVLIMLADYYEKLHAIFTRLKGLMVYPLIVLGLAFGVSAFLSGMVYFVVYSEFADLFGGGLNPAPFMFWISPTLLLVLFVGVFFLTYLPRSRQWLRWHLPGFKEAALAQLASVLSMLLRNGSTLPDALLLMEQAESGAKVSRELRRWQELIAQGHPAFYEVTERKRIFPALFTWLVAQGGEDIGAGFDRAASIYAGRSAQRTDMMLYAVLPVAIMSLGLVVLGQLYAVVVFVSKMISYF